MRANIAFFTICLSLLWDYSKRKLSFSNEVQMGQAGTLKSAPAELSSPTVGVSWVVYRRSPGCG